MKKMYRIKYKDFVVEGRATSKQNACRLAFKELIKAGLIKKQPPTDVDNETTFKDTHVELISDEY